MEIRIDTVFDYETMCEGLMIDDDALYLDGREPQDL